MHFFTVKGKSASLVDASSHPDADTYIWSSESKSKFYLFCRLFFTDQNYVTYSATAYRKLRLILLMFL